MTPTIIVDIDGTLCDASHRMHLIESEPKDWDAWYAAVVDDEPVQPILQLVDIIGHFSRVDLVTGRCEDSREQTEAWLSKNGVRYNRLLMRKLGDHRPDTLVKTEIYNKYFEPGSVWFALEDRDRVVKMWRDLGVTCLQVREGDY